MISRRLIDNIDWILIGLLVLNSLVGVFVIFSASHHLPGGYHWRQLVFLAGSLAVLFVLLLNDYQVLLSFSFHSYGAVVSVLALMLAFDRIISTGRWIKLPVFQIQPA